MTKTEAAKTVATHVRVQARETGREITLRMCETLVAEYGHRAYEGSPIHLAALVANPATVYRIARRDAL